MKKTSQTQFNRRSFVSLSLGLIGATGLTACGLESAQAPSPAAVKPGRPAPVLRSSNEIETDATASASGARGASLARIYEEVTSSMYGFTVGNPNAKKVFYVVFDPMCPHCGNTWVKSKPLHGDIKFIWMPVPLLGEKSANYGAMIMASANPAQAMDEHEISVLNKADPKPFDEDLKEKGLPAMETNNNVSKRIRLDGVPFILHRRDSGEIVSTMGGIEAPEFVIMRG